MFCTFKDTICIKQINAYTVKSTKYSSFKFKTYSYMYKITIEYVQGFRNADNRRSYCT